eukprot:c26426_g1_i1 orf=1762-3177(+)
MPLLSGSLLHSSLFLPLCHQEFLTSSKWGKKKASIGVKFSKIWHPDGRKHLRHRSQSDFILTTEQVTQSCAEEGAHGSATMPIITVSVVSSISIISAKEWDLCAVESTGPDSVNPFVTHAFLSSLEDSGCAVPEQGWLPQHLVAKDGVGNILGVVPLYLKSHSNGEYVFDHSWANAFYHYGGSYYPKLQCCVPFTPVTGPRLLVRSCALRNQVINGLAKSMQQLADRFQVSSLHATFLTQSEWKTLGGLGFLQRLGMQYHWENRNYSSFDAFLMDLKQSRRKTIRQERKKVQEQNLKLKHLRGADIKAHHWDAFYAFYRNTTDNKWGQAYLTKEFFHMIGSRMEDRVLLIVAEDQEKLVAGALNIIGGDTLFGRLWGCLPQTYYPNLHFETCYYQAIEAAIEWNLKKVEAGAQGEHKIHRGYMPTETYSSHYFTNETFNQTIRNFLKQETLQVQLTIELLKESSPFKSKTL